MPPTSAAAPAVFLVAAALSLTGQPAAGRPASAALNDTPCHSRSRSSGRPVFPDLQRAFQEVLGSEFVADRRVAYRRLSEARAWTAYLPLVGCLESADPGALQRREEQLAFWINLYNALVIHGVIESGIPPSVARVPEFFSRSAYRIGGLEFSLDEIEHGILRANRPKQPGAAPLFPPRDPRLRHTLAVPDPRIHFALVCGARSCPPLRVYAAERIDAQLDSAARAYLNASVQVTPDGRSLRLPMILSWFEEDFGGRRGVLDLLRRTLDPGAARQILDSLPGPELSHIEFDWSLNDAA